jgi:hypothetical protein
MSEWLKQNGGPPALVIVGIPLLFAFWPVGAAFMVVGLALWAYGQERFPLLVVRKGRERRELLGLAQELRTELETDRSRLSEAKRDRRGWFSERNLRAEVFNTRWTPSRVTADQVAINDALRGFYVWADEMNHRMSRRASNEVMAVGRVLEGKSLDLDDADLAELDEGLSRIKNAHDRLDALVKRLAR